MRITLSQFAETVKLSDQTLWTYIRLIRKANNLKNTKGKTI